MLKPCHICEKSDTCETDCKAFLQWCDDISGTVIPNEIPKASKPLHGEEGWGRHETEHCTSGGGSWDLVRPGGFW